MILITSIRTSPQPQKHFMFCLGSGNDSSRQICPGNKVICSTCNSPPTYFVPLQLTLKSIPYASWGPSARSSYIKTVPIRQIAATKSPFYALKHACQARHNGHHAVERKIIGWFPVSTELRFHNLSSRQRALNEGQYDRFSRSHIWVLPSFNCPVQSDRQRFCVSLQIQMLSLCR